MQLQAIRTEVRDRSGVDSADGMAVDAVLTRLINSALREVANMRDWDWLKAEETITTVVGQTSYARNAAARVSTLLIDDQYSEVMRLVTPRAAASYARYDGRPMVWHVQAGSLIVYPKPSTVRTLTHTYLRIEPALVDDTDVPIMPDYAIDLVIVKAALKVAARTDNTSQHRLLSQEEKDIIESLASGARRSKGAPIIDSRRDWG